MEVGMQENKLVLPSPSQALPGRKQEMPVPENHFINGNPLKGPIPEGFERAMFGLGCFWGAEKIFWLTKGVYVTAVGYASGSTSNPTYEEVCSGLTGHNEVVYCVFNPDALTYKDLLKVFWEGHNPTQGMRQGNDVGTQYRSGIYVFSSEQRKLAEMTMESYGDKLSENGFPPISTEILDAPVFYYAEEYHQQYLAKIPHGYCGLGGTGIRHPDY